MISRILTYKNLKSWNTSLTSPKNQNLSSRKSLKRVKWKLRKKLKKWNPKRRRYSTRMTSLTPACNYKLRKNPITNLWIAETLKMKNFWWRLWIAKKTSWRTCWVAKKAISRKRKSWRWRSWKRNCLLTTSKPRSRKGSISKI